MYNIIVRLYSDTVYQNMYRYFYIFRPPALLWMCEILLHIEYTGRINLYTYS